MRVAFLSHFYPPLHNAGIEHSTHGMARTLLASGHHVRVLCVARWTEGENYWQGYQEDTWEGVPVRRLNLNWMKAPDPNSYLYDNPVMAEQVRNFLTEFAPDVVHVTSMYTLSTRAVQVAKDMGFPIIFTMSDFWLICPRHTLMRFGGEICDGKVSEHTCQDCMMSETRVYRLAQRVIPQDVLLRGVDQVLHHPQLATRLPGVRGWGMDISRRRQVIMEAVEQIDCVLSPSQYTRDIVLATGMSLPNVQISNYGNDLSWLKDYQPRTRDEAIHIGYLGQITPIKGIHLLIEAFKTCLFQRQAELFIHGRLDETSEYVRTLRELAGGDPRIHFMGAYQRSQLPQILGNLDVTVVPSIWPEVAGLVVQEAFAAGLPVVASNLGGLPEFVQEGRGGLVFDPNQHGSLERVLAQVVNGGYSFLDKLRVNIPPVRTLEDESRFLVSVYSRLIEQRRLQNGTH
jgi:glycosyltransferase involved in cell wall biosynthesis